MAKLDDFSKIIHNGNEIGKVLHQGKTIWSDMYLAQDSDFVNVNEYWVYRGAELEVEIPTHINGQLVTSTQYMFRGGTNYQATAVTKVVLKHSNVTDMQYMFRNSDITTLDLSNFNTSNVTNMSAMFQSSSVTSLDLSNFDTSNVTNMSNMFASSSATTLDLSSFDTSKVTDMSMMFYNFSVTSLDLSNFDTSNVTSMGSMFAYSSATTGYARTQTDANKFNSSYGKPTGLNFVVKPSSDVYLAQDSDFVEVDGNWTYRGAALEVEIPTHINGQLVTSTSRMFSGDEDSQATTVTKVVLNHSNVINMEGMFSYSSATTLDLSNFNTSNVTDMEGMFAGSSAISLDLSSFNISNVINMSAMFWSSPATIGYARTQADADKFNASSAKPTGLNFVVKP